MKYVFIIKMIWICDDIHAKVVKNDKIYEENSGLKFPVFPVSFLYRSSLGFIFQTEKAKHWQTENQKATGWPRSYRKYILQIPQPSQYGYAKSQYRFAVTSGSPSKWLHTDRQTDGHCGL